MISVDFADLDAEVFGCLRVNDTESVGWLSPPSTELQDLHVIGSAPALTISGPEEFELALEPLTEPAEFGDAQDWLCRAVGNAGVVEIDCLAHVARSPLAPEAGPRRTVSALMGPSLAVICRASGPDPESGELETWILRADGPVRVDDPRLSTAYAADGSHNRTGLELWETEESEFPLRLAAERVARARLELAGVQLDCAFMRWHHDGRIGAGCYELASARG